MSSSEHKDSPASLWCLLHPVACDAALLSPLNIPVSLGLGCAGVNCSGHQQGRSRMGPHQPWAHSYHQQGSESAFSYGCDVEKDAAL